MKRLLLAVIFAVACSGSFRLVAQEAGQGPRLASAIIEGNLDAVEKLLDKGADVNAPLVEGLWPLDAARICGRKGIEKLLVSRGAKKANAKSFPPGTLAPDLADLCLSSAVSADSPGFSVLVSRGGKELFCRATGLPV